MNYLLDTCVLSEFARKTPHRGVVEWVDRIQEEKLFLCAITVGEVQRGIARLPESHRKTELLAWMNNGLLSRFSGRILPLDGETMLVWGELNARLEASGRPLPVMDGLIAASALKNNLVVVTRSTAGFIPCGVQVNNPWE